MKSTHVICANDSIEAVVLRRENESDKDYEKRANEELERLAKEYFEKNKWSFKEEPLLGQTAYDVMRHRIYWHLHTVKTLE